jgi:5-methylcytosine-specific restriction endonuclease McrBC regulatory subunit McrC
MKIIYLTNGGEVKVDDADFAWLNKYKWYAKSSAYNVYACRNHYDHGQKGTIRMHREITQCPDNMEIDHVDGDPLNNQRANLQIVSKKINIFREHAPLFRPNNHKDAK